MTFTLDDKLRDLCRPLFDVKYVVGMDLPRIYLDCIEQYTDLILIYNQSVSSVDSNHCMELLFDDDGVKYAKLSFSGIKYALSIGSSIIPEKKSLKHAKDVSLRNAKNVSDTEYLVDKLVEENFFRYDSLDFAGGMSNVNPKFVSNSIVKQSFDDTGKNRDYFLN